MENENTPVEEQQTSAESITDGETAEKPQAEAPKVFTEAKINAMMAQQRRDLSAKYQKDIEALRAKIPDERESYKAKYEEVNTKYSKMLAEVGQTKLEAKLAELNAINPRQVAKLVSELVEIHEGQLVASREGADVTEELKDFLNENSYLLKPTTRGGVGSKAPEAKIQRFQANPNFDAMSAEELEAWEKSQGVTKKNQNAFDRRGF